MTRVSFPMLEGITPFSFRPFKSSVTQHSVFFRHHSYSVVTAICKLIVGLLDWGAPVHSPFAPHTFIQTATTATITFRVTQASGRPECRNARRIAAPAGRCRGGRQVNWCAGDKDTRAAAGSASNHTRARCNENGTMRTT